jgi:hypothetical protein
MGTCWIPVGYHGKTLKNNPDVFLFLCSVMLSEGEESGLLLFGRYSTLDSLTFFSWNNV